MKFFTRNKRLIKKAAISWITNSPFKCPIFVFTSCQIFWFHWNANFVFDRLSSAQLSAQSTQTIHVQKWLMVECGNLRIVQALLLLLVVISIEACSMKTQNIWFSIEFPPQKKTTTHGNRKCYRRTYSIPGYPNIHTLTYSVSWWNCWWFSIKPMAKLIHILFFTFMPNISIAGDWALFRIFTKIQSTILYQSIAGIDIYDFIAEADFHILSRFSAISVVHYVGESLGHQFGRSRYNWVNFSTSTQLCWTFLAENVK